MRTGFRHLLGFGINEGQTRSEQRRIRAINAAAVVAFVATAVFAVLFIPARREGMSLWVYAGILVVYLTAYATVLALNRRGRSDGAAALLLWSGLLNTTAVNFTVGFSTGTAVFFVAIAVGALFVTDTTQVVMRWTVIVAVVFVFGLLVVVDPPVAPTVAGTWIEAFLVVASFAGVVAFVVAVVWYQRGLTETAEKELVDANEQSERLLLNILPAEIADRLRSGEYPIADSKPEVTVLFADIVGSTSITEALSATDLVTALDALFSSFDDIADKYGLEKIKTVGDSYFAVAGLSSDDSNHADRAADAALQMRQELSRHRFPGMGETNMRFGLHTGPVTAGVIGKRKFSYDVWGDTVNTASRMEATSDPGMIQVSERTHERLKAQYRFEPRGMVAVKGKGDMSTYFLTGKRDSISGPD